MTTEQSFGDLVNNDRRPHGYNFSVSFSRCLFTSVRRPFGRSSSLYIPHRRFFPQHGHILERPLLSVSQAKTTPPETFFLCLSALDIPLPLLLIPAGVSSSREWITLDEQADARNAAAAVSGRCQKMGKILKGGIVKIVLIISYVPALTKSSWRRVRFENA